MPVENPAPAEPTRAGQTYLKHGVGFFRRRPTGGPFRKVEHHA